MKLLVTGAGGFIGSAIAIQAARAGHAVVGTIRPGGNASRLRDYEGRLLVEYIDLRDTPAFDLVLRLHRPDVVVHAAWSGIDADRRNDLTALTENIATACGIMNSCVSAGVRKFIGLGSQAEYGLLDRRVSEIHLPQPTTFYGASKVTVLHVTSQLAARAGISFAWLRVFATYGPGDNRTWLIPASIEAMLNGQRPRTTLGLQRCDYLFIDDAARAVVAVASNDQAVGVFNLGGGKAATVRTIIEQIRDLAQPNLTLIFGEVPYRADQVWHLEADIDRLKKIADWNPEVDLPDGIAQTVYWHQSMRG